MARGLKPLPISKDFSPSKNGWFDGFFEIFANRDPFLRVFLSQKRLILQFFRNFFEIEPSSKDFLTKMGPMSKDFWWKTNPFGRHIPVCLNMWVPPPHLDCNISPTQQVPDALGSTRQIEIKYLAQGHKCWSSDHEFCTVPLDQACSHINICQCV